MLVSVRVRGIYATALSWLLHRKGFLLSDVSEVLRKRLPLPPSERPPDVTVKSLDDPEYILVIGYPWEAGASVEKAITEEVRHYTIRRGRLGLYTVVDVEVTGDCRGRVEGVEVRLDQEPCPEPGSRVRASIVREALEPGQEPLARPGVRLVGSRVIVSVPGEGVSFSEHIRDPGLRADLLASLIERVDTSRVHVHFRSGARVGDPDEAAREAEALAREAGELQAQGPGDAGIVRRGEYIAIIGLPRPAKEVLDDYRSQVTPTLRGHHSLKSMGDRESSLVDCAEEALSQGASIEGLHIEYHLARKSRRLVIDHYKPDGSRLRLGPFNVDSVQRAGEGYRVTLTRTFTRPGTLDGLGVEKRPGDTSKTIVEYGKWYVIHEYMDSSGHLLGVYANVNTPPEIGQGRIKYLDLYVDVVKKPGEPARIIDEGQLREAAERGLLARETVEKALETAEYLRRRLDSSYP